MSAKLDKLRVELEKARKKNAEWETRVKELETRYCEQENTEIHDMVHAANLTPDQLSNLLRMFAEEKVSSTEIINPLNEEETKNEV